MVSAVSFLILIAASSLARAETVKLTFEELPGRVRSANPHVGASQVEIEAARAGTGFLARSYLPRLTAEAGAEAYGSGAVSARGEPYGTVEASLNLFRSGRDRLEERQREARLSRTEAQSESTWLDELTKARQAYWQLIYQTETAALLQDAVTEADRNLGSARKRFGAGLGTETDRFEFEISRTQYEQELARARLARANSQRTLRVLIGLAPETEVVTAERIEHVHQDDLFGATLDPESHRDVRAQRSVEAEAGSRATQSRLWWAPALDLYSNYTLYTFRDREYARVSDRVEAVVGARVSLDLFDGLQGRAAARESSAQARAAELRANQTARELNAQFERAKQELKLSHELMHGAESNAEMAQKYLKATLSEYQRGQKNSPDVASAAARHFEARRRLAELKRDYQLARSDLLAMLGK